MVVGEGVTSEGGSRGVPVLGKMRGLERFATPGNRVHGGAGKGDQGAWGRVLRCAPVPGERWSERGGRRGPCALHRGSGGVPSAPRAHRSSPRRRPPRPVPAPSPAPSRCSTPAPPVRADLPAPAPPAAPHRPQPRPSRDWLRRCPPANGSSRRLGRHREPGRSRQRRLLRSESAGGSAGRGGEGRGTGGRGSPGPSLDHPPCGILGPDPPRGSPSRSPAAPQLKAKDPLAPQLCLGPPWTSPTRSHLPAPVLSPFPDGRSWCQENGGCGLRKPRCSGMGVYEGPADPGEGPEDWERVWWRRVPVPRKVGPGWNRREQIRGCSSSITSSRPCDMTNPCPSSGLLLPHPLLRMR